MHQLPMKVGLAGVGWRDGEKMQTIVTEKKIFFSKNLKKTNVISPLNEYVDAILDNRVSIR